MSHKTRYRRRARMSAVLLSVLALMLGTVLLASAAIPVLKTNTSLALDEDMSEPITKVMLQATDADTPAENVVYQLARLPAYGTLRNTKASGNPQAGKLNIRDTFTQDDIDKEVIEYAHDGSEVANDNFAFTVSDGSIPNTARVSLPLAGTQQTRNAWLPSISANGRFVAFQSQDRNLVANDTGGFQNIFVYDRETGKTQRVSVGWGDSAANGNSYNPSISADGLHVAFESDATNLLPTNDTKGSKDVFVYDRAAKETQRVSVTPDDGEANGESSNPSISADGRYVAFQSAATDLSDLPVDTNNAADIFVYDRNAEITHFVSVAKGGTLANGASAEPSISSDGMHVAFESDATNLTVPSDNNGFRDIFVYDRGTRETQRVSAAPGGGAANSSAFKPSISDDGETVAFQSNATNLTGLEDNNGRSDIFVYVRATKSTERVSVATGGVQATGGSQGSVAASISADGWYITFQSDTTNLIGPNGDTNGVWDVFVHDRHTGVTERVSVVTGGAQAVGGASVAPSISADGRLVAFHSEATNLSSNTNGFDNVFVVATSTPHVFNISINPVNDEPNRPDIADQTIVQNTTGMPIPFSVTDPDNQPADLVVELSSSNPSVVPITNRSVVRGGGDQAELSVPTGSQTGSADVTVTVSDGEKSTSDTFTVNVVTPAAVLQPAPWLVMLYLAGDDTEPTEVGQTSLSEPIRQLQSRLATMPPNPHMRLVVLSDGNQLNDSFLYVREPGATGLSKHVALSLWPSGVVSELDTGSVSTLRNFVTWARTTYPGSAHTMLSIVNHGGGWAPDPGVPGQPRGITPTQAAFDAGGWRGMSLDLSTNNRSGSSLSTKQTGKALDGLGKLDVLFFDACLMGMIESAAEVQPYADYFIAGENLLWSRLPYERYLDNTVLNATTTPRALATTIVERYNQPSPPDEPFAIAALELAELPAVTRAVNNLAQGVLEALPKGAAPATPTVPTLPAVPLSNPIRAALMHAYSLSQKFDYDSNFALDTTDGYVDLVDFAAKLKLEPDIPQPVKTQAQIVINTVGISGNPGAVIAAKTVYDVSGLQQPSWKLSGAHGLAIYLPLGELDCRPTGLRDPGDAPAVAPCVATTNDGSQPVLEPQLRYYADPYQLAFTRDAPYWAELLLRLEAGTPLRRNEPFQAPAPAESAVRSSWRTVVPLVTK